MGRRKGPARFVIDKDGADLFIRVADSGINPLILMCDGLMMVIFGKDTRNPYLRVEDVAKWYEDEFRDNPNDCALAEAAKVLRGVMERFKSGDYEENPRP